MQKRSFSIEGVWRAALAAAVLLTPGPATLGHAGGAAGASRPGAESGGPQPGKPAATEQSAPVFRFRRGVPSVKNPYCEVVTYVVRELPVGASSTQDGGGRAVIVIDAGALKGDRDYAQFLMAHECCHHSLGHVKARARTPSRVGPQPFYYLLPRLKAMELEADRCAVRLLKGNGACDAIESARAHMLTFGNLPTGAHYPTGVERADNIARVAVEE